MVETLLRNEEKQQPMARQSWNEAYGASQIGPFDYCPRLGFREYWYPGIWKKQVGRRPVNLKMLGEDLVLFRGKDGKIAALSDWCPHRGARLSRGYCEFDGTVACPYHGYVFDETGQCVAGLIESPQSPLAPKMRARHYPTAEWQGVIFIWMGETAPVPLEEDLPWELQDPQLSGRRYTRVKNWNTNWTEPVWQGIDYHEFYLHRGWKIWTFINYKLPFFRPKPVYTSGAEVIEEGDNFFTTSQKDIQYGQAEYPGLGKWPKHVWWRRLAERKRGVAKETWAGFNHGAQLPSIVRIPNGGYDHMRWGVPVDPVNTRMWTFGISKTPKTIFGQLFKDLWYYFYQKPFQVVAINEKEDFPEFEDGNTNPDVPHKLGTLDSGVIYFRRHLSRRSRDYRRLGGAYGSNHPPTRTAAEWHAMEQDEANGTASSNGSNGSNGAGGVNGTNGSHGANTANGASAEVEQASPR